MPKFVVQLWSAVQHLHDPDCQIVGEKLQNLLRAGGVGQRALGSGFAA
jgi:hypothetical protein